MIRTWRPLALVPRPVCTTLLTSAVCEPSGLGICPLRNWEFRDPLAEAYLVSEKRRST